MTLKELRKQKGLTQERLAEKTGIPIRTIRSYEQGTRKIGNVPNAVKLCKALKCKIEDLLEDEE